MLDLTSSSFWGHGGVPGERRAPVRRLLGQEIKC